MKKILLLLIILLLNIGCVNAIEPQWQSHAYDIQHTGQTPYVSYTNGTIDWSLFVDG